VIAGLSWVAADLPPKIDGKELVIEFEVRCPEGFEIPSEITNEGEWYLFVTRDHGDRSQRRGNLELKKATKVDGRLIIPASVYLHTSDGGKSLGVAMPERIVQFYNLPLPSKPNRSHMNWSEWMPGPTFGELDKIAPKDRLAVRYRVQFFDENKE
jgi:hypothetical protein